MTVVFTDFANFTALSESSAPKIVPLLNDLLGELVPVIGESHQGYVNKFMGDGIMFFYNAPQQVRDHACDAVATVLDMQLKLAEFNQRLAREGLPLLAMRGGIATGIAVVGDAGYSERSDYTCLGIASTSPRVSRVRTKSPAHTPSSTTAQPNCSMDSSSSVQSVKYRPSGRKAVMCYEPITKADAATENRRKLAAIRRGWSRPSRGRFDDCLGIAREMEAAFGQRNCHRYIGRCARSACMSRRATDFDGRIVLTEK